MNKNLLHQQSTVKTGPRLMNCTLCHDWSGVNEASMIRVDSNCSTYIIYTQILDGGYLRSEYYTLFGEEFLLVFALGDETCSSMVIQVHQDIGDTGYIQIQVTQSKHIITKQKHRIVKAECYVR